MIPRGVERVVNTIPLLQPATLQTERWLDAAGDFS